MIVELARRVSSCGWVALCERRRAGFARLSGWQPVGNWVASAANFPCRRTHLQLTGKGRNIPRDGVVFFFGAPRISCVIESWRRHYNTIRPHASIGYKPPAPEVFVPAFAAWPAALRRPAPPATLAQRPTLN